MAKYRKLSKRFWSDAKTRDLTDKQRLMMIYCITGLEACSQTSSGIYELHRSSFQNYLGYNLDEATECLKFFNEKKSTLLEYNFKEHVVFVKSFIKYNAPYGGVRQLIDDFEETFHKVPEFWAEFGQIHRKRLGKFYEKISHSEKLSEEERVEQINFLDRLINLKNEINEIPSPNPKAEIAQKVSSREEEKNR